MLTQNKHTPHMQLKQDFRETVLTLTHCNCMFIFSCSFTKILFTTHWVLLLVSENHWPGDIYSALPVRLPLNGLWEHVFLTDPGNIR